MQDSRDLAWAAGFFDGEGCVQLVKRTRKNNVEWRLQVSAVNTDLRPLEKLKRLFGGSIQTMQRPNNPQGYRPSWAWMATHRVAEAALRHMLPWLTVKREQAELAIQSRQYVGRIGLRRSPESLEAQRHLATQLKELRLH